jgi:hypothetical protein
MSAPAEKKATPVWVRVVLWGLAYAVIGTVTAALSRGATSAELRRIWRLAAWVLSLGVFAASFSDERSRAGGAPVTTAIRAALGVAVGAFLLAAWAMGHSLSAGADRVGAYLVALAAWPCLVGVPAFLVAWLAAVLFRRTKIT